MSQISHTAPYIVIRFLHFHRFGAGYILGLPAQWRIDREKGEGKGLVVGIRGYDADKRRRGGNMFAVDASRVGRLKALDGIQKGFGPNDEFVPVSGRVEHPVGGLRRTRLSVN